MKPHGNIGYRVFFFCGMIAPVVLGAVILAVGLVTPDYSPISDSISLMGTPEKPYAWLMNCGYCLYGVLMASAAFGLNRVFFYVPPVKRLSKLLGVHALGTILLAVFPDSTTSVSRELIHNGMSALAYAPLLAGIYTFRSITRYDISFRLLRFFGLFVLLVNVPMPFVYMIGPFSSIGGLLQRLLSCCSFLWLRLAFFLLYKAWNSIVDVTGNIGPPASTGVTNHIATGLPVMEVGNILQKNNRF